MDRLKRVVCALLGHSKIVDFCIGQVSCARCGQILGDTLTSVYLMKDKVIVNHNCETCIENYERLTWKDKLFTPNPFDEDNLVESLSKAEDYFDNATVPTENCEPSYHHSKNILKG